MKVKINNYYLNIEVRRNGTNLVILHPTVGRPASDLKDLIDELVNAGYTTAAINQRGVNGSTGKIKNATMKEMAGDIAAVIKAMDMGPAHIIGHLFGTSYVRTLAEYWPELVKSIITITISGIAPAKINALYALECLLTLKPTNKILQDTMKKTFFAENSNPTVFFDGFNKTVIYDSFVWPMSTAPQYDWIRGGKAPMLIIQGLEDKISPPESGYIMKDMYGKRIQVVDIPNAGHQIVHEQPQLLSEAILNFLDQQKNSKKTVIKEELLEIKKISKSNKTEKKNKYELGWKSAITKQHLARTASHYAVNFLPYLKKGMSLLDCGCGPGSLTVDFAEYLCNGEVIGIDIQPSQIEIAKEVAKRRNVKNVNFYIANIYSLPFENDTFDAAWLCTVIMHLEKPKEALKEIYRVLKPGGIIAITDGAWKGDIIYPEYPILIEELAEAERRLNKGGMKTNRAINNRSLLRKAGFKQIKGATVIEYYGTPNDTKDFADFIIKFTKQHFPDLENEIGFEVVENAWKKWGEHPDAYFSRVHIQAIGWKKNNRKI